MYKTNIFLILVFILIIGGKSIAQQYPFAVLPGQTQSVAPEKDTLWILKDSQLRKAIGAAKELKISNEQLKTKDEKIKLIQLQSTEKDSLISLLKKDRDYYVTTWKNCDADLQKVGSEYKKCARIKKLAFWGIGGAFAVGLFAGLFIK